MEVAANDAEIITLFFQHFIFFLLLFIVISPTWSLDLKPHKWEGTTNQQGAVMITFKISSQAIFFLQGYIFYKKNWRPTPIFWNKAKIWFDLGPSFKKIPYKIFFLPLH